MNNVYSVTKLALAQDSIDNTFLSVWLSYNAST